MLRLVLKDDHGTLAPVNSLEKLGLFKERPDLLKNDVYEVKSDVSLQVLDVFLARVVGYPSPSGVTDENIESLKALCNEFGFDGFDSEFEAVAREKESLWQEALCGLKARADAQDVAIDHLNRQVLALRRENGMLQQLLRKGRSESNDISVLWRVTVKECVFSWMREMESTRSLGGKWWL